MSNYGKGEWTDVVDGLYWKFIDEKRNKLKNNPRIGMMTKMIDNMKPARKEKYLRLLKTLYQILPIEINIIGIE